jgi:dienelactone hydrolase
MQITRKASSRRGIIARVANRAGGTIVSLACLLIALALIGGSAFAQPQQPPAGAAPGRAAAAPPPQVLPSAWQHPTGPYAVAMEEEPGLPGHTIYRPANLAALPKQEKLPVVTFSGPGCVPTGTAFRPFYTEVASHGFLVFANGPAEMNPGAGRGAQNKAADHLASIDWATAENGRKESKYYQRVDTSKIAAMGQSCGGLQVLEISKDPRITALVMWNSGVFNQPMTPPVGANGRGGAPGGAPGPVPAGSPMSLSKDVLKTLRVPIAYFVGKTDMANPNAADDFTRIDTVPVFFGALDIPGDAHGGTFRETNGGKFGVAAVAWLKWQFKGDQTAARMFKGADCGLCKDPQWEVRKKKID